MYGLSSRKIPKGGLTADKIIVNNGSVASVAKGLTYKGGYNAISETPDRAQRISEIGPVQIDYYHAAEGASDAATAVAVAATIAGNGTVVGFPEGHGSR